jgi:hypothetical protein
VRAADTFCLTGNLDEAAGTLVNFSQNNIMSFFHELARGKCVRLQDKLRMLLVGEWRGVRLFSGWRMSRKRGNMLRMKYPYEFTRYQYMF